MLESGFDMNCKKLLRLDSMPKIGLRKREEEELFGGPPRRGPLRGAGAGERRRGHSDPRPPRGALLRVQPAGLPAPHAAKLPAGAEEDAAVVERRLGARLITLVTIQNECNSPNHFVRLIHKL